MTEYHQTGYLSVHCYFQLDSDPDFYRTILGQWHDLNYLLQ